MVRVLHIVTNMDRGGLETMLMNYYRHIDRSKVQFDFIEHRMERAAYDDEIESLGGRIYRLPRLNPLSVHYYRALDSFFKKHPEYIIVHSHLDCMSAYPLHAAKKAGVPVRIAHAHSTYQDRDWKLIFKSISKRWIRYFVTDLFACSKAAGKWMFGTTNVNVLPNAIDVSKYVFNSTIREEIRKELNLGSTFVVGHVGRFSTVKNHTFLLDVFKALTTSCPYARLLLVGDGEIRKEMENKAVALGIRDKVLFTGVRADVDRLLQAMDVFVFPSLYEGLPVTMVEAQARGLPCLISEKVPLECILTKDLVEVVSLSVSPEEWANIILAMRNIVYNDQHLEIAERGFDITIEAIKLQKFYLNKVNDICKKK